MPKFCSPWRLVSKVLKAVRENIEQAHRTNEAINSVTLIKRRIGSQEAIPFRDEYGRPRRRDSDAALG
jgi:hypothetical protein